jgi:hypothetical protein
MGIPVQPNAGAEAKAKSKRDLMWEQRMNAKKNIVNPPTSGSLLDAMNPASRSSVVRPKEAVGFQKGTEIH